MREIKFRAWDKTNNKMLFDELEGFEFARNGEPVLCRVEGFSNMLEAQCSKRKGQLVLMQYTGLKDKNGQELYEGDILKEIGLLGVIECHAPSFKLRRNRPSKTFNDEDLFEIPDLEGEIIGNIYENSDLLEGGGSDG